MACAPFALSPFHGGGRREIVRRPKDYGFDTGFVAFVRGWHEVGDDDRGLLWEHLVLDILRTGTGAEGLFCWRDKSGREVDVAVRRARDVHGVEREINPDRFDPESLKVFRGLYPHGRNYLVCPGIQDSYERRFDSLVLRTTGCRDLLLDLGG